jgi:hypothetical protein
MRTVALLDTAIGQVKAARDHLRHDDHEPADLSAVIGTLRELVWTIDTLTARLVDTYARLHCLGHDDGLDPTVAVAQITGRLAYTRRLLDGIDGCLADAHNTAAKLHPLDGR